MLSIYLNQDFSADTRKTYKSVLTRFLNYLDENNLSMNELTPEIVLNYVKNYKDTTQNKIVSVIKTYYKWLTKTELAIEGITPQSFRPDRKLDIAEAKQLLAKASCERDRLMMKTLFTTGIRVKELATIKKDDIKIEDGAYCLNFIAKGNKKRKIKLQSGLARELLDFYSFRETLFGIGQRQIERIISKLSQEVLNRNITPHCFRHGFATELMNQGISFQKIQEELGHESITTTLKYLHNKRGNDSWFIDL
ncbi:MAG: tyrosine-type recombinase/integrase [Vampirovibrionia bacterium]